MNENILNEESNTLTENLIRIGKNIRYLSAGDIEEAEAKGWTVEE